MDAEVLDAVAVVDIAPSQATEWFDLVNGAYSASSNDWDAFPGSSARQRAARSVRPL
jgi:hypothetical protein